MPTKEQIIEFLEQYTNLEQGVDYNIMPGRQGAIVLTMNALVILIDKFEEDPLKEAEKTEILAMANGVGFEVDISSL